MRVWLRTRSTVGASSPWKPEEVGDEASTIGAPARMLLGALEG